MTSYSSYYNVTQTNSPFGSSTTITSGYSTSSSGGSYFCNLPGFSGFGTSPLDELNCYNLGGPMCFSNGNTMQNGNSMSMMADSLFNKDNMMSLLLLGPGLGLTDILLGNKISKGISNVAKNVGNGIKSAAKKIGSALKKL